MAWADSRGLSNADLARYINVLRADGGADSTWPDMINVSCA